MSETLTYETINPRTRKLIMAGLAIALFAACFDGTITTTCGPAIGKEFNAMELLPWLTTAYLLAETVTIPLSGKLSDLYGRKKLLMIGLALFGGASLFAGIATNMYVVIIARGLQGAGGGILIPVATAAVSDLYAPEDRGKIQGGLGALFGIGMGLGPLIGGFFANIDHIGPLSGWHYAFLINLAIVVMVFFLCAKEFPVVQRDAKPIIDFKGVALISAALILVVIYFQMLGKYFGILDMLSLIFLIVIVLLLRTFSWWESQAKEPIIAPHVFSNPTVYAAAALLFLLGLALVGDELFMGMYLQKVAGLTPMSSGLYILIMVVGMMIASVVGGAMLNKTGIKPWVIAGPLLCCIGFFLFSTIQVSFNPIVFSISEFLFGLGSGCLLASLMTAVQNSCEHRDVGMTTSAVNLMRNVGSTIGTSVFTLIANTFIMVTGSEKGLPAEIYEKGIGILNDLGGMYDDIIKFVFTDSVAAAFGCGAIILVIAVIIGLRFKIITVEQTKSINDYTKNLIKDNQK